MKTISKSTIITLCFIVVGLFVIPACDDPIDDELYLHVKVENAAKYSNVMKVKLMMTFRPNEGEEKTIELARGDWKGSGFTIKLPEKVDPNYLYRLTDNIGGYITVIDPPETVSISNKNVKIGNVMFIGVDRAGKEITRFYPLSDKQDAYFTYADTDVAISGYSDRMDSPFTHTEYDNARVPDGWYLMIASFEKIRTIYSINWKKGWNIWSFSRLIGEAWVPAFSSELKWYGEEDMEDNWY